MLAEFSGIIQKAQVRLGESPRTLRTPVEASLAHEWEDLIDRRALCFLQRHSANEWWFWYVLQQAAMHAIGPRIQLAHVVEAMLNVRRRNQQFLLDCKAGQLSGRRLNAAVAVGAVVLDGDHVVSNPLFQTGFDPVQAAVQVGGCSAI